MPTTPPLSDDALMAACREQHRVMIFSLADLACMRAALMTVQNNLVKAGKSRDPDADNCIAALAESKLGTQEDTRVAIAGLQALYEHHVCTDCRPKTLTLARRLLTALGYDPDQSPAPVGGPSHDFH